MSVLCCERVADGDVDRAVARIGSITCARTPQGVFVAVADERVTIAQRELAFAGIRADVSAATLAPSAGTRAALGRDLTPLPLHALALDLVEVRALSVASETRALLHTRRWRRGSARDIERCRALLHETDASLAWRRRAWTTREILRSREARRVLRPVIFDVAAIGSPPEHRSQAADGALGRWLFG
jgi:hypothetical protein